jgi:hypothetical protein
MMADAFLWAAGIDNGNTTPGFPALPAQLADVISNSWGASNAALSTALQNAFDQLTDNACGGRGCVVTFSTGNLGYVQFSNVRRFAAYDRNLAVGASINVNPTTPVTSSQPDPNGNTANLAATVDRRAFYNPFGPEMDVVAPSHTCYDGWWKSRRPDHLHGSCGQRRAGWLSRGRGLQRLRIELRRNQPCLTDHRWYGGLGAVRVSAAGVGRGARGHPTKCGPHRRRPEQRCRARRGCLVVSFNRQQGSFHNSLCTPGTAAT